MSVISHGSDLRLSPAIGGIIRRTGANLRRTLQRLASAGFATVQLDANVSGLRPRELTQSARRDLISLLRRYGASPAGIDLFIPRKHYLDPQLVDRAMTATTEAIAFAADLGRLPLSLTLPAADLPGELAQTLIAAADGCGVPLAVHSESQMAGLEQWIRTVDLPTLGAAVAPAALLSQGQDPAAVIQRLGDRLLVARLSDLQSGDSGDAAAAGVRCPVGQGDLDLPRYRVACDLAQQRIGPVILDLRGLSQPLAAATQAQQTWTDAAFTV